MIGRPLLVALLASGFMLAGCSQPAGPKVDVTHVHGLDYVGGQLYVATHHGLVLGAPSGKSWYWDYVGHERFDFMGFTTNGETFYSSGHPDDPYKFGGTMLGLRRSTDQGHNWEQRSLKGQADFHALTVEPRSGDLLGFWRTVVRSTDGGLTWNNLTSPPAQVFALASSSSAVWAGTLNGLYSSPDGLNWTVTSLKGPIGSVAIAPDASALFASQISNQGGATFVSRDAGSTWTPLGGHDILKAPQAPILFAFDRGDARHMYASDAGGTIIESTDGGASWKTIRG